MSEKESVRQLFLDRRIGRPYPMLLLSASVSNSAATAITSAAATASSFLRPSRLSGVRRMLVEACIPGHLQHLPFPL